MKFTIISFSFALIVLAVTRDASAQTKAKTPPPPPLDKALGAKAKGRNSIPPPPPLKSLLSKRRRSSASMMTDDRAPGADVTGRNDLSAKVVPFYPVSKGLTASESKRQTSAYKTGKRAASSPQ